MPAVTEILRDAQALALFSNLEPQDVETFRKNYPAFVPQDWWDYQPTDSKGVPLSAKQWRTNQRFLREAWKNRFTGALDWYWVIQLTMSVFDPKELGNVAFPFSEERPTFATPTEIPFSYPHQKAVLYLYQQPWRARFCQECNKRFVAAESKNKYCSEACFHENRNRQKRKWFAEHGSQLRASQKNKKKRSPRVLGTRRAR